MNIQPGKGTRKVTCKPIISEPPEQIHLACTTVLGRRSVSTVKDNFNKTNFEQYLTLTFLDTRQRASKWNKSLAQEDKSLVKKKEGNPEKIYPGGNEPLYSFQWIIYFKTKCKRINTCYVIFVCFQFFIIQSIHFMNIQL